MFTLLMLGSGIFWTATYILIIRRSFLDHTYGMPLVALCANISWEGIFSFIYPPFIIQHVVNLVWFALDTVIFIQLLRYGPREFADLSKRAFYGVCSLTLLTGFGAVFLTTIEFHDSGVYSAFGQNLMMSVLFLMMLYRRRSLRGQSFSIALCKLLGTAFASLAFFLFSSLSHRSVLLPFLYVTIFIYDVIYLGMVYRQQRDVTGPFNNPITESNQMEIPLS
jgi:hypothetical protein